ncbi:arylalkylamine N-acetyltransferase 1-like isoform X2 [Maniola hyperantus]|uniref:arylalkylamine N-acetyltransferase 1-like isoform X2 n=1 Tax=Aphantopus hyperantus TaxID=2795564 RepID=UPI003747EC3E
MDNTLADNLPKQLSELNIRPRAIKHGYTLQKLTPKDKEAVIEFLRKFFFLDEPLNQTINLLETPESRCYELEEYASSSLGDGASIAAVDENGDYVGIVINGVVRREEVDYTDKSDDCPHPKFKRILKLLGHLDREARIWDKLDQSCHTVVEVRIASTHSDWRGRGLMRVLCEETETFYIDEPLNLAVGMCLDSQPCPELDSYCTSSLYEGFSFKATDDDGNVVGAMINGVCPLKEEDDGNDLLSQAQRCTNPKFQKILYILARRETGAKLWEKFPADQKVVEVKVAATDPNWRRRGIMNALLEETEKAIKEQGIRLIRLDTSSAYSAMSAEHYGYTCYYRALYKDIKMDGQPLVVPAPPHLEDRVYVKELYPLE